MESTQFVKQLDSFVKIIQPGLFAFAISMMLLEVIVLSVRKISRNSRGGVVSLSSGLFVFGFEALADFFFYLALCYWLYQHRIFDLGFKWYAWLLCFVLYDLMFYASHRLQHRVRVLWCFHSVHHTSTEMRLTSAVRGSIFDFIYNPPFFVWLCVLGIHPLMFIVVRTFSRLWGILEHIHESAFGHTPFLNKIFIMPDVHRVHHGKNRIYLDRNYAEIFSFWDRLFGTYTEYSEQPVYGILKPVDDNSFMEIQFSPWKQLARDFKNVKGWRNKMNVLLKPPGWEISAS
jgi:sterol desaturase/sphingolipid hydroxylase (fatty acid hydroxylase superfamily)